MKKERINPESFKLCKVDQVKVDEILDNYPSNRKASAVIPLLHYKSFVLAFHLNYY